MTNTNKASVIEITASSVKFACGYSDGKKPILLHYVKKDFNDPSIPGANIMEKIKNILSSLKQFAMEEQAPGIENPVVNLVMPSKGFICYTRDMTTNVVDEKKQIGDYDIEMLTNMIANEQIPDNNAIVDIIPSMYFTSDHSKYEEPPLGVISHNLTMRAMIHTIPRKDIETNSTLVENCGYRIISKDVACYCAAKMFSSEYDLPAYFYVDLGSSNTSITFVFNNLPYYSVTFQMGGVNLTSAIAKAFGIKMIDAENIKKQRGYDERITSYELPLATSIDPISGEERKFYQRSLNEIIESYFKDLNTQIKNGMAIIAKHMSSTDPNSASKLASLPIVFGGSSSKLNGIETMVSESTVGRKAIFYCPSVIGASDPGATNVLGMILAQANKVGKLSDKSIAFTTLSRDKK